MGKPNITELKKLIKKRETVFIEAGVLAVLLTTNKITKKHIEKRLEDCNALIRSLDVMIKNEALNE